MKKEDIVTHLNIPAFYSREIPSIKWNDQPWGKGLCPFHRDQSHSFSANRETGRFVCFGCGARGSVFDFIMRLRGLNFRDACDALTLEAGVSHE